ncbi:MAG: SusE domain-containing protein [Bacteroidales bacterium]|nr:SusE domain-containing protein [Bacteroidales bacterium]
MKFTRYILGIAGAAVLLSGCEELEKAQAYAPDSDMIIAPVLSKLPAQIEMSGENLNTELTFNWDAADFGVPTQVNYSVEASVGGQDKVVLFSGIAETSYLTTYQTLNTALTKAADKGGLGLVAGVATDVHFHISATIGTTYPKYYSNAIPVNVTCTDSEPVYPAIYVIGDYCSWNHDNALRLFDYAETDVTYTGMVDFMWKGKNGFKVTGAKDWNNGNWGIDNGAPAPEAEAAAIQLIDDGGSGNISAYAKRFYRFSFDKSTLVLTKTLSFDYIGVIGDFNGWGGDVLMYYDNESQRFFADVEIPADGGLKFRLDQGWDSSFGTSQSDIAMEGKLDGSGNISVPAGNYRVYVNMNNPDDMTFKFSADDYQATDPGAQPEKPEVPAEDVWGLVGTITGWADGADIVLEADGDWLVAKAVALTTADEFKFRANGVWGNEKTVADGTIVEAGQEYPAVKGSGNIKVAADGTYDICLASSLDKFCIMPVGQKPSGL